MKDLLKPTADNFEAYAVENYTNRRCLSSQEYYEDLGRLKYIKRLLRRYKRTGELKERLILNHLISFYNVFDMAAANRMMFFKIEEELHSYLKTFLVYLNYLPQGWYVEIPLDQKITETLRNL